MKNITEKDYRLYMGVVRLTINRIESDMKNLEKHKLVEKLSYSDWVKYINGELKL